MEEILVPIAICVVLPVMIVWLINRTRQNETNRKTEIMLKAIESGATIDADFFKAQQEQKAPTTLKEKLLNRLTAGCVCTFIGIAAVVVCFVLEAKLGWDHVGDFMLTFGAISIAIGISFLLVFFVGKKMLAKEMEAEAKALEQK
jgi:preprotein translocase subunit YajC